MKGTRKDEATGGLRLRRETQVPRASLQAASSYALHPIAHPRRTSNAHPQDHKRPPCD